jgi:hypothetical protein
MPARRTKNRRRGCEITLRPKPRGGFTIVGFKRIGAAMRDGGVRSTKAAGVLKCTLIFRCGALVHIRRHDGPPTRQITAAAGPAGTSSARHEQARPTNGEVGQARWRSAKESGRRLFQLKGEPR